MYLTAHRVWSRKHDQDAIHAFHYRHPESLPVPLDLADIADNKPGILVASRGTPSSRERCLELFGHRCDPRVDNRGLPQACWRMSSAQRKTEPPR